MIGASVRIFVCREPQDLRRSFDGLAFAAKQVLGEDPQSGALFCFLDKRANRLKCLWWASPVWENVRETTQRTLDAWNRLLARRPRSG